jgi:hypothetical protein
MSNKLLTLIALSLAATASSNAAAESRLFGAASALLGRLAGSVRYARDLQTATRSRIAITQGVAPDLQPQIEATKRALSVIEAKVTAGQTLSPREKVALKQMRAQQASLTSSVLGSAMRRGALDDAMPHVDALVRIVTAQKLDGASPEQREQIARHVTSVSQRLIRGHLANELTRTNNALRKPIMQSWVDDAVSWGETGYYRDFPQSPLRGATLPSGPYEHYRDAAERSAPHARGLVEAAVKLGVTQTPAIDSTVQHIELNAQKLNSEYNQRNERFRATLGQRGQAALVRSLATRSRRDLWDLVLE